jgi:hypothetical protein
VIALLLVPLTARPNWIIRIEDLPADEGEGRWYIILDMVKPEWRLEKRESATPAGGASAVSQRLLQVSLAGHQILKWLTWYAPTTSHYRRALASAAAWSTSSNRTEIS